MISSCGYASSFNLPAVCCVSSLILVRAVALIVPLMDPIVAVLSAFISKTMVPIRGHAASVNTTKVGTQRY